MNEKLKSFERLLTIMDELREKCPWDKEQTFESLRQLTIEETHELSEAILDQDWEGVRKELGDVLLHIVFYAKMGSEKGSFDIQSVIQGLCDKLVFRHPHIYGQTTADTSDQVKENWEKLKLKEKKKACEIQSVLTGVPKGLPAMIKASRIQEKVKAVGFDWDDPNDVWGKVEEELQELQQECLQPTEHFDLEKATGEFGDVLFSLVNYARFMGIDPEDALEATNRKFIKRFQFIEEQAQKQGKNVSALNLTEMNAFWEQAKSS